MKQAILIILLISIYFNSFCQEKFGYIDLDKVLQEMPSSKEGVENIQDYANQLDDSIHSLLSLYENKIQTDPPRDLNNEEISAYNDSLEFCLKRITDIQTFAMDTIKNWNPNFIKQ